MKIEYIHKLRTKEINKLFHVYLRLDLYGARPHDSAGQETKS